MATKKSRYVIVRSVNAGVFAGTLVSLKGQHAVLENSRRIWYWAGSATLSELAELGTSKPAQCKFPCVVAREEILDVCEIIDVTPAARKSIESVPVWSAH